MRTSLSPADLDRIAMPVQAANAAFMAKYPGERTDRQPVHTFYGGAHLFRADSARKLGQLALRALDEHAPDAATLARAFDLPVELAEKVRPRVAAQARGRGGRGPAHRLRGRLRRRGRTPRRTLTRSSARATGARPRRADALAVHRHPHQVDDRRDAAARRAHARPFPDDAARGDGRRPPPGFVVMLPKPQIPEHPAALADALDALEPRLGLAHGSLAPRDHDRADAGRRGRRGDASRCRRSSKAARGRCIAAHFGTYDYTASCGITAAHQHMTHPACDFAKHCMQASLGRARASG